jgi:hypothetical protein
MTPCMFSTMHQHTHADMLAVPEGAVAQGSVLFCIPTDFSGSSASCISSHSSSVLSTCQLY